MDISAVLIAALLIALLAAFTVVRAVRIVPQAGARNIERLGRYHRTLQPGLNFVIPYIDRVHREIDLREQVVSFRPQPVITEDNLVVEIDTVLYFQVTDPRAAAYEIASYLQGVEQLTVTTLVTSSGRWTWSAPSPPATPSTANCAAYSTTPPANGTCASTGSRSRPSTRP